MTIRNKRMIYTVIVSFFMDGDIVLSLIAVEKAFFDLMLAFKLSLSLSLFECLSLESPSCPSSSSSSLLTNSLDLVVNSPAL